MLKSLREVSWRDFPMDQCVVFDTRASALKEELAMNSVDLSSNGYATAPRNSNSVLMSRKEAAAYLGVAEITLVPSGVQQGATNCQFIKLVGSQSIGYAAFGIAGTIPVLTHLKIKLLGNRCLN